MKPARSYLAVVILIATTFALPTFGLVTPCVQTFASRTDEIPEKEEGVTRIMQFNVENLVRDTMAAQIEEPANPDSHRGAKSISKTREIVALTERLQPDVAVWEEVEDLAMMKSVQSRYGMKNYTPYMLPSNDKFGIGMWVRKDSNYTIQFETHREMTWSDPTKGGKRVPLFSRDVPALLLTRPGSVRPDLIVLGIHAKSMRDRNRDPKSVILRTAQFVGERQIIEAYRLRYGSDVSIVAVGDHNTDVRDSEELKPLNELMIDSFDVAPSSISRGDRGTHFYFPRDQNQPAENKQLDAILISRDSNLRPIRARIVPYRSLEDAPLDAPTNFRDRKMQPSDHHAIILDLRLAS